MKFILSFAGVLVAILLYVRFVPSAPINPVLPVGPQKEVNGHNSDVPPGGDADSTTMQEERGEAPSTSVPAARPGQTYGVAISPEGAVPMSALATALGSRDSAQLKLIGKAQAVCQAKGCWMTLPTADGKQMRVRFRDYAFFVPKDLSGHNVVVSGWAHRSTVPKTDLQHYAKDAGKSSKEIAAITQDEQQLTFLADGVLVQD
ncbi:DUF4920 domain-containing protein [Hymenobacter sp. BT770]|uniref:DUF4920 domain-containing protein n=1 Tax=Hymenobacter sp. BT770 TaxID=2886942 RepID=UPI001D0F4CC7|nr:DUF4920 domain-containing protein [Hymenobacter sp. BT770]MCC3152499.1 DUF4920 domain-containing protein [Hymenobacter sp. BT770]MDO3414525.1 DUF4920 domain-containing protein [Hymenobacter sp. BT770]